MEYRAGNVVQRGLVESLARPGGKRAVFDRYHIVSRGARKAALALLNGDKFGDNRAVRLETRRATR